jgi:hypothetical protein
MTEEAPAPLHTVVIDGTPFTIRKDFHGRIRPYAVKADGLEQGVGRMQGYSSVKEAFDAIYVRQLQD